MSAPLRRFAIAFGLGAIVAANVAAFAPFNLYVGNKDEFSAPLLSILSLYALPSLAFSIIVGLLGVVLGARGFARFTAVIAALACLLWLQGNILVWDYGPLDGSSIPWLATAWRGVIDSGIWLALLLLALYGYGRFGKPLKIAAAGTFAIQVAAFALAWLGGAADTVERPAVAYDRAQHEAMFRFSPDENVLHIVMDGFQSDLFAEIVRDPENEELRESLSGFTFFEEHMGSFPYTEMTMPLLTSGEVYRNHIPKSDFLDRTMRGETILNVAEANGYEVDIASQISIINVYARSQHTNVFNIPVDQHVSAQDYVTSDAVRMMDLSLFRVTPHFVKAYIYQDDLWFLKRFARSSSYLSIRYFAELDFLRQVKERLTVDRAAPTYKLFHLMLAHRPTVGNEQCEYDNVKRPGRRGVTLQARCGLQAISGVLDRMKELDIYDKSLIVLMADHGAWLAAPGFDSNDAAKGQAPSATFAGMAVPTLAIKPQNAAGPLQVSRAPTTIGDVPRTIASLIGADASFGGQNVFEIPEMAVRPRHFYNYAFGPNEKAPDFLHAMKEFEVVGSPFDASSWRAVRLLRPKGEVDAVAQTTE